MCTERLPSRQQGITMVELVVFIVIISIGLVGILGAINLSTRNSANPMLVKQQVAIAETLLEEIESKPFTWCDPDDANVTTATSTAACTTAQGLAATSGESRYNQITPYDNVGDYNTFKMPAGILQPLTGDAISGLGNYNASVAITQAGTALGLSDNSAALRIDVTVSITGQNNNITLTGYRYRYAPQQP